MEYTEELIELCAFDETEMDTGTSGLCGMFALALYREVLELRPTLVLVGGINPDGSRLLTRKKQQLCWSHAAVKVSGEYYDIEGLQKPEWLINNYEWGLGPFHNATCTLLDMAPVEFVNVMRQTKTAVDWAHLMKWRKNLQEAKKKLDRSRAA